MADTTVRRLPDHVRHFVDVLRRIPAVASVRLGGSRGARDWDLLVYLRPLSVWDAVVRALPPGTKTANFPAALATALGEATLVHPDGTVDCAFVDVARLEWSVANSERGRFALMPMTRSLEGMPSYVLEAEAALSDPIVGLDMAPERPPTALVTVAAGWWSGRAALSLLIAEDALRAGDPISAQAHCTSSLWSAAHGRALRDGWYLPDKRFLVTTTCAQTRALAAGVVTAGPRATENIAALRAQLGLSKELGLAWARTANELGPGDADD